MKDTDKLYCRILLDVLEAHGVKEIVASPGSRNAPLLISCSYRHTIKTHVVTDERNAAFMAMGISMVSKRPVAIISTSGTALYNYAPAIAEAYYQGIPLIVISADRPFHWIDQEDSQTLIQNSTLSNIVKKSYNIPVESDNREIEWYVNRVANEAIILSTTGKQGPVHINIQFDAPLSNISNRNDYSCERFIKTLAPAPFFSSSQLNELTEGLAGKKILVVVGYLKPENELNKYLSLFSMLPGVKVLCETISNIHLAGNPYAIDSVISGLSDNTKHSLRPDIVISIGGALVSGMLKSFIRKEAPDVWTLGDSYFGTDVFKNLKLNINIKPGFFFKALYYSLRNYYKKYPEKVNDLNKYTDLWKHIQDDQLNMRNQFVDSIEWSELKAFRYILNNIPRNYNLFLSNGTCVRYAQLFTTSIPHASYANRGVSGIEGTNATAAGCSIAYKDPTILLTGDMSFSYSPGVMGLESIPKNFKIIVINNKGGGIFRFISPTRYIEHRDRFFCADQNIPVRKLAEAYEWKYLKAENEKKLSDVFKEFIEYKSNAILEIVADEEYSASILRKYMRLNAINK